jgi:transposase InsO family protein
MVEESELGVKRTLARLDIPRSSFYRWYDQYTTHGFDGLKPRCGSERRFWNRIPDEERKQIVETALEHPEKSPRELAWHITDYQGSFVSESSVYRILKAQDLIASPHYVVMKAKDKFQNPTRRVHEMWQTDFTYLKVVEWGWYYLLTILDDYSRYIIAWKFYTTMGSEDVQDLLDEALETTGVMNVTVRHRPRLLSDNGPCFVAESLKEYLDEHGMTQTHGRPMHPQTQGKIERYHGSMKNVVKLQHYYSPGGLERAIGSFNEHYNHRRVHESLDNLTPADVYAGRGREILSARDRVKAQTMKRRRRLNKGLQPRKESLILPSIYREVSFSN